MISLYLRRNTFWCFSLQWQPFSRPWRTCCSAASAAKKGGVQKNYFLCLFPDQDAVMMRLQTYLDIILLMTFCTQAASGSRQTFCSVFFRVALQRREEQIWGQWDESFATKAPDEIWSWIPVLHYLRHITMGVGGDQLHLANVATDGAALCLDAAAVLFHSEAPQVHSCWRRRHMVTTMQRFLEKEAHLQRRWAWSKNLPLLRARKARSTAKEARMSLLHMTE